VLRSGASHAVVGHRVAAPSTVGTFLRGFRWGHVRQLDAVSRELLRRAWTRGAGTGDACLTLDVDSTICETYGLHRQGGSRFTYTHVRGYHDRYVGENGAEVWPWLQRRGSSAYWPCHPDLGWKPSG
jgi:hypothetical protein